MHRHNRGLLHSQTAPSTPLRNIVSVDANYANFSVPTRTRISGIHLPPQELSQVMASMSRRASTGSRAGFRGSRPSSQPNSRNELRHLTPRISDHFSRGRRLSDRLTIRRRRRSSIGVVYDAGYVGPVTKDFLRAFSRALIHEKQRVSPEEDHDKVFEALDQQHRLVSPKDRPNEFDHSLPLPAEDVMQSPMVEHVLQTLSATPEFGEIKFGDDMPKPEFKSYLERILESRKKSLQRPHFLSIFDRDSPLDSGSEGVNAVINTSRFVIENTLSGLPDFHSQDALNMRLAEPLVVGNLSDHSTSDESIAKENEFPSYRSRERSSMELPNKTPEFNKTPEYKDIQFDKVNLVDVPQWESVLFFPDKMVTPDYGDFNDLNENLDHDVHLDHLDHDVHLDHDTHSDLSDAGLILGHFTMDNDAVGGNEHFQLQPGFMEDRPSHIVDELAPLPSGPRMVIPTNKRPRLERGALPQSLVKGLVSLVRHTSLASPPRKKTRNEKLTPALVQLITSKSNEFLQQVMADMEAYAGHRGSKHINIQDTVLYLNRLKAPGSSIGDISKLAQTVFPLELLVSLDNSLQESASKKMKQKRKAVDDDDEYSSSSTLTENVVAVKEDLAPSLESGYSVTPSDDDYKDT